MWLVIVLTLGVAVASLAVAVRSQVALRRFSEPPDDPEAAPLPAEVQALRNEVAALRQEGADALKHLAVVRYDALEDAGGQLSWSMALTDDRGNGVVMTSINGRGAARSYAKSIVGWSSDSPLAPEEEKALSAARGAA